MLIFCVVLVYAGMKFMHLLERHNPDSSSYLKEITEDDVLDLNQAKYRIAFSIEDYVAPRNFKTDSKFVRWEIRLYGLKSLVPFSKTIPHHECT